MKTSIVWFKTDLRLSDNETLTKAVSSNSALVPVYCLNPAQFATSPFGFKKTGSFRARFLLEALEDLDKRLRTLGSGLVVVKGAPEEELPKIASRYGATRLFAKKEVAHEELEEHARVEAALWKVRCETEVFSTSTLYHATDLPFSIKDIPDVFTTFRQKVEKEAIPVRALQAFPQLLLSPGIPPLQLPTLAELGLTEPPTEPRSAFPFKGGESHALQRLQYVLEPNGLIRTYKDTRNRLIGTDYSSKLSPWLALGCLSPRSVYHAIKQHEARFGANDSTYWLVFELLWRDYFRFMMKKHHNRYFQKFGIKGSEQKTAMHRKDILSKWIEGTTGVDFVDANMRELRHTGFMSNRGRQIVASYLCNDLKLDWRYGAAYFEEYLIDYDVCSNWGNWAYVAGVGNDPRKDRYFNVQKQAALYDPDGLYRKLWLS